MGGCPPTFSAHCLPRRFSDPRPHLEAPAASSRRATRPFFSKSAPLGHGWRLPAPPPKGDRRAAGQPPSFFGAGAGRVTPPLIAARVKKEKQHRKTLLQKPSPFLRSFVDNERRERRAALREQRERKPSEESREIAAHRVFFGLRRAELARLRRLSLGLRRFSACGAKRTRPKSQACGGYLLTCLLTRRGSGLRANGSKQIHLLLFSSTLRSSFVRC